MSFLSPTQLKICGIKTPDEAAKILALNVDFIGVIFAKSKRQVDMMTARQIANLAHQNGKKCVGVFASGNQSCDAKITATISSQNRNSKPLLSYAFGYESGEYEVPEFNSLSQGSALPVREVHKGTPLVGTLGGSRECNSLSQGLALPVREVQNDCEIMEIAEFCGLDVAQIHGEISENLYLNLKDLGCEIWRALSVGEVLPNVTKFADLVLYDCKGENLGGNGKSFNWNLLKNLEPFSFGLAGGIGEENVSEALKFNPKIIDINSKVEDENLQKIPQKVEKIAQIVCNVNLKC